MEPLEKRQIFKSSSKQVIPSLDKRWQELPKFLPYDLYPSSTSADVVEEWLQTADLLISDLDKVLSLPCHIFWSHLIHDDSFRGCIDSFLRLCPRDIDGQNSEDVRIISSQNSLYRQFFKILLRATTCKESKEDYITPVVFGDIIYGNYIFDIPKLMDICVLYGSESPGIVQKMIESVLRHQSRYLNDLTDAVPLFQQVIDKAIVSGQNKPRASNVDLLDLTLYLTDIIHTLYSFINISPELAPPFHRHNFYRSLGNCYENGLTKIKERLQSSTLEEVELKRLYKRVDICEEQCVQAFRQILYYSCIHPLLDSADTASHHKIVQSYLDAMTAAAGDPLFIGHYEKLYPFEADLDIINSKVNKSDSNRIAYIKDAIIRAQVDLASENMRKLKLSHKHTAPSKKPLIDPSTSVGAAAADPRIAAVQDLFPSYTHSFIQACLKIYETPERVANALIEESLPPELAALDREADSRPLVPSTLVDSRRNVYDNDEFDVFRNRTVDSSKVFQGKSKLLKPAEIRKDEMKEKITLLLERSEQEEMRYATDDRLYDDEYDDTYDSHDVGSMDRDAEPRIHLRRPGGVHGDEDLAGRNVVTPRALGGSTGRERRHGWEKEEEDDPEPNHNSLNLPPPNANHQPRRQYDVKGAPKGKGQSESVLKNRNFKTAHKSTGANHNRRAGARSKLNKGMF